MARPFQQTEFLTGAPDIRRAPPDTGLEVAFAGRSNAGKSSALNTITGRKSLARTSKAPGRTREINFFAIDPQRRLVDLPGYGYAKVSRTQQVQWQHSIARYLEQRQSLHGVILLMDVRHPLREQDCQVIRWCHAAQLPAHILLTKSDKLKRGPAKTALMTTRKALVELHPTATIQLFSSHTREGLDELLAVLVEWLDLAVD